MAPRRRRIVDGACARPAGLGRIIRDEAGRVTAIVEDSDAHEQRAIDEINTGFIAVPTALLTRWVAQLEPAQRAARILFDRRRGDGGRRRRAGGRACRPRRARGPRRQRPGAARVRRTHHPVAARDRAVGAGADRRSGAHRPLRCASPAGATSASTSVACSRATSRWATVSRSALIVCCATSPSIGAVRRFCSHLE